MSRSGGRVSHEVIDADLGYNRCHAATTLTAQLAALRNRKVLNRAALLYHARRHLFVGLIVYLGIQLMALLQCLARICMQTVNELSIIVTEFRLVKLCCALFGGASGLSQRLV